MGVENEMSCSRRMILPLHMPSIRLLFAALAAALTSGVLFAGTDLRVHSFWDGTPALYTCTSPRSLEPKDTFVLGERIAFLGQFQTVGDTPPGPGYNANIRILNGKEEVVYSADINMGPDDKQSTEASFGWWWSRYALDNLPVGSYRLCASIDTYDVISETDESNNTATYPFRVLDAEAPPYGVPKFTIESGVLVEVDPNGCQGIIVPTSVKRIGARAFAGLATIKSVVIPSSVTQIDEYAFSECSGMISVEIPNSVTNIGSSAFSYCTGLRDVTVPQYVLDRQISNVFTFYSYLSITNISYSSVITNIGNYAFQGCGGLTRVTIPDSVASIGNYAFQGCGGLTRVTIPDSVASIGNYAFYRCSGLTRVTIPDSVSSIGTCAFEGCSGLTAVDITDLRAWCRIVFGGSLSNPLYYAHNLCLNGSPLTDLEMPNGVPDIESYAFYNCSSLTSVTIPDSVTSIGFCAFYGCSGLTRVVMPDSVKNIWYEAFRGCSGLTSVTIPNSVVYISGSVFRDCSGLTSVTIPNSVTSISGYMFYNCSGLTSVTIPDSVTSIENYAFYNCSGLTSVTIPDSVTSIGSQAFYNCSELENLTVGAGMTSGQIRLMFGPCVGLKRVTVPQSVCNDGVSYVFYSSCGSITNVAVANGVTRVASRAFAGLDALQSVRFPESLRRMGDEVFSDCYSLASVWFDGDAPDVGADIYVGTPRSLVTYVWEGSRGWSGGVSTSLPFEWSGRALEGVVKVVLSEILISGAERVESGGTADYSCTATMSDGAKKIVVPTWSIVSGGEYASISASGVLTAADTDVERVVMVLAVYTDGDTTKRASMEVRIAAYVPPTQPPAPPQGEKAFGPGYGSLFAISENEIARVVGVYGLGWSDFPVRAFDGYRVFADGRVVDREKGSGADAVDHDWCETYAKLVMCVWTGWSRYLGFTDEDALADYLLSRDERDVLDCAADRAVASGMDMSKFMGTVKTDATLPRSLTAAFANADSLVAVMVYIGNYRWYGTLANWGHFVVCCGYSIDPSRPLTDPNCLKGLFIIDSDNDRENGGGGISSPDTISYCPVSWDAAAGLYEIGHICGTSGYLMDIYSPCVTLRSEDSVLALWSAGGRGAYTIKFDPGGRDVEGSMPEQIVEVGKVAKLNPCAFSPPSGRRFAGWRRPDGRRYDDGVLVFNLAGPGGVVTLTAIWE